MDVIDSYSSDHDRYCGQDYLRCSLLSLYFTDGESSLSSSSSGQEPIIFFLLYPSLFWKTWKPIDNPDSIRSKARIHPEHGSQAYASAAEPCIPVGDSPASATRYDCYACLTRTEATVTANTKTILFSGSNFPFANDTKSLRAFSWLYSTFTTSPELFPDAFDPRLHRVQFCFTSCTESCSTALSRLKIMIQLRS